jgi:cyclin B
MAQLRLTEAAVCPAKYLGEDGHQPEVTAKMRAILVDWLVEVHFLLKYKPETLHLAVYVVDKFGGSAVLQREKLQLVGVASLLLACKACQEPTPPDAAYLAYLTASAYAAQEVSNNAG